MAWTPVSSEQFDVLERQPVDGGWLYRNRTVIGSAAQNPGDFVWQVAMTFVPEPAPPLEARRGEQPRHNERAHQAQRSTMNDA